MLLYTVEGAIFPLGEGNTLDRLDQLAFDVSINIIGGIKQVREELTLQLLALAYLRGA